MSYKAFQNLKEFIEIDLIKQLSPEEINEAMNKMADKATKLEKYRAECEKALGSAMLAISNKDDWALPTLITELVENLDKIDSGDI